MTCPAVHALGDGHVSHDVINKVQQRIENNCCKNDSSFIPFSASDDTQTDIFFQSKAAQNYHVLLSSNPGFNLSILSTIRLIL